MSVPDDVMEARALLTRLAEPPAGALSAFVDRVGPVEAVAHILNDDVPASVAGEIREPYRLDDARWDLDRAERMGARLVVPEHDEWPTAMLDCLHGTDSQGIDWDARPLALWVRGPIDLAAATHRAIAVTGSRAATGYGEHVAAELGFDLARNEVTVVNGLAYGIDTASHRGALLIEHRNIAVLGCGIGVDYPAGNARLLHEAAERGAVISEYSPSRTPTRERFLARMRLITALSAGIVIVEAGVRSGCQTAVREATAQDRTVMAAPGPVTSAVSKGTNALLRDGAAVAVTSTEDILESVSGRAPSWLWRSTPDTVR